MSKKKEESGKIRDNGCLQGNVITQEWGNFNDGKKCERGIKFQHVMGEGSSDQNIDPR
jgi:hypothetical protein